jgi:hypothetical protein
MALFAPLLSGSNHAIAVISFTNQFVIKETQDQYSRAMA